MTAYHSLDIVSVNVGLPRVIGVRRSKPVISGIDKVPVAGDAVDVTESGIAGDGQADLVAHGGRDKAIYAYPSDHLPLWTSEHRVAPAYGPGTFGENLSVAGADESRVRIGDRWRWGDVILEVCQPRYPCFKLGMKLSRPSVVREMVANGRTGWYLRVLQAGSAPVSGQIELIGRDDRASTVAEAHQARLPGADPRLVGRVASEAAIAERLRISLMRAIEEPSP